MYGCSFVIFPAQVDYNIEIRMKRYSNVLLSTWQLNTSVLSVLVTCKKKIMADVLDFFCIFIFSLTSIGTKIYLLRLVVPELLLVLAYHLGYNELHLL